MSKEQCWRPLDIAKAAAARRGAHQVVLAGSGTEFLFFIATKDGRQEGYRIPKTPEFNTANNPGVVARDLQVQEMGLADWATSNGIPSAEPLDLFDLHGYPVLVLEVVEDDGSVLDSSALGAIISRMHEKPVPSLDLVAQNGSPIYSRIVERLVQRYDVLGKYTELPLLPPNPELIGSLENNLGQPLLTHLDLRRQNVRVRNGQPHSIFDWSNALVAAPEVELARVQEYAAIPENGLNYEEFHAGYGQQGGGVTTDSPAWPILRLDTAAMLAVVFSSVAPNEDLRTKFLGRVRELVSQL
ncbi:phosphotransferase [Paenarthrobacter sp. NPDC092416]|uniref:phosphotransferase n=1 Tax=Paenarthrobacter sp. NPDC092416 TaxID=3364386 RepID=UPI003823388D